MAKKFIRSCRPGNSPTPTPLSKRSKASCKNWPVLERMSRLMSAATRFRGRENLQILDANRCHEPEHPLTPPFGTLSPSGGEGRGEGVPRLMGSRSRLGVESFFPRRVMGAWWPSRSSKPLSARSTSRGMFDSYPLRHFHLRFAICDLRFEHGAQRASTADPLVHRKSPIVNSKEGGGGHVAQTAP